MGNIGSRHRQMEERTAEKFPHYRSYAECQSKAFMSGMIYLATGAAVIVIVQELARPILPFSRSAFLVAPVLGGSVVGYVMTRRKTRMCQDMWMALEDKHSYLKEIEEKSITGIDLPQETKPTSSNTT